MRSGGSSDDEMSHGGRDAGPRRSRRLAESRAHQRAAAEVSGDQGAAAGGRAHRQQAHEEEPEDIPF